MKKSALIIPTYYCEKHCKYCMYRDKTYDTTIASVEQLSTSLQTFIEHNVIEDVAIGNGGNITALGLDYIDKLLGSVYTILAQNKLDVPVTLLANVGSKQDVEMWETLMDKYDFTLSVSLNSERPFNKKTERCLKLFEQCYRDRIGIVTVFLPSIRRLTAKQFLDYIEQFKCASLTVNEYDDTTMGSAKFSVTINEYYQFLYSVLTWYYNNDYTFELKDADILSRTIVDREGNVDYIIDQNGIGYLSYTPNNDKTIRYFVDDFKISDQDINKIKGDRVCLMCAYYFRCPERFSPRVKDKHTCETIIQILELIDAYRFN